MKDVTCRPLLLPRPANTSARCFQKCYLVCIYRAWSLFLILSTCCPTVHFTHTRPHSPTTLAYESITHRSTTSNTHTIHCENGHAPICAYCHFSFPLCQLGSHNIAPSHCFSTYSDATLNCPQRMTGPIKSLSRSSTCTKPATRSATVAPTQLILTTNHCERRYDYHPYQASPDRCHTMFVGSQKHRYQVKAHRESTADPIHASSYRRPLVRLFAGIYTSYPANELYIVSCFLAPLIVEGPLGPWGAFGLLTCDYAARLDQYSSCVLMLICHFMLLFLSTLGALAPFDDQSRLLRSDTRPVFTFIICHMI